ncbi:MAG: hypothetical protein M1504_01580 [Candidatus Marsarchaeota archaeon]|nr:hypothetical protein [Candidatus Marsarchaeota archaeon]
MAKSDVERVTEEKIAKGGVLVKFYFDMQHKEKDKLQPLIVNLINENLMKEPGVVYCYGSVEPPLEKEGVFITSGIVTMLFDSFLPLMSIVFRYAPAGIEVLKPEKGMHFNANQLQSMLMDLSELSIGYSTMIFEKVLKKEDVEAIKKQLDQRAELGRKFLNKDDKKTEENEGK